MKGIEYKQIESYKEKLLKEAQDPSSDRAKSRKQKRKLTDIVTQSVDCTTYSR